MSVWTYEEKIKDLCTDIGASKLFMWHLQHLFDPQNIRDATILNDCLEVLHLNRDYKYDLPQTGKRLSQIEKEIKHDEALERTVSYIILEEKVKELILRIQNIALRIQNITIPNTRPTTEFNTPTIQFSTTMTLENNNQNDRFKF